MKKEGNAIVYCQGMFNTPNGKTAHGLVRFTRRYRVLSVVDARYAGEDARTVLDGCLSGISVEASIEEAFAKAENSDYPATHLVIGLAPDGGLLGVSARKHIKTALRLGLNVDCGLHDFLSEDPEMVVLAKEKGVVIRDVRKPPKRTSMHFFSGKIESVKALKIAVLGTDSAVGKRTTAWLVVQGFQKLGLRATMVGTGQTAWMQGADHCVIMDSLVNDFVSGEIEHAVWSAWEKDRPNVIVIEGQGSLMNPAYPGGFELLAGGRPDVVVLQHAPARVEYDGFSGYPIQPLAHQIQAIELLSGKPVVAVCINHENLATEKIPFMCEAITMAIGRPAFDVLRDGPTDLVASLKSHLIIRERAA
jgi:uncharacterized NAD-dependent epimerase/dehydratase family protein